MALFLFRVLFRGPGSFLGGAVLTILNSSAHDCDAPLRALSGAQRDKETIVRKRLTFPEIVGRNNCALPARPRARRDRASPFSVAMCSIRRYWRECTIYSWSGSEILRQTKRALFRAERKQIRIE